MDRQTVTNDSKTPKKKKTLQKDLVLLVSGGRFPLPGRLVFQTFQMLGQNPHDITVHGALLPGGLFPDFFQDAFFHAK